MNYGIDTSGLIDGWDYYPPKVFPCLWDRINDIVDSGVLVASEEVFHELQRKQDELAEWARQRKKMFITADGAIQAAVTDIMTTHGGLVNVKTGASAADPWVIAVAQAHGLTVVSAEIFRLPRLTIPSVCADKSVPTSTFSI